MLPPERRYASLAFLKYYDWWMHRLFPVGRKAFSLVQPLVSRLTNIPIPDDDNGNMTTRGSQTITWDAENRPVSMNVSGNVTAFVYDGDGNRVKKITGGATILYVNKYYERNLTTGENVTYYYLGDRLVSTQNGTTLSYIHQDHLTGTVVVSDDTGAQIGSTKYYPYGDCRNSQGNLGTDKLFTGQRLDGTGLYYYNARYYDPTIGRFISPDPFVQWSNGFNLVSYPLTVNVIPLGLGSVNVPQGNYPAFTLEAPVNPQALNRYSYVINNPLQYTDPYGWWTFQIQIEFTLTVPGFAFSVAGGVGFDDNGHVALVGTAGVGASSGLGLTGGVIGTRTGADTIGDLSGPTPALSTGVSVVPGIGGVLDYVTEIDSPPSYTGVSGGVLIGIELSFLPSLPADVHAMSLWQGDLTLWDFGEKDQATGEPELPIESSESSWYDPYWYDPYYY